MFRSFRGNCGEYSTFDSFNLVNDKIRYLLDVKLSGSYQCFLYDLTCYDAAPNCARIWHQSYHIKGRITFHVFGLLYCRSHHTPCSHLLFKFKMKLFLRTQVFVTLVHLEHHTPNPHPSRTMNYNLFCMEIFM